MLRENIYQVIGNEAEVLFVPKNSGLRSYTLGILRNAGVEAAIVDQLAADQEVKAGNLEFRLARGNDIPVNVLQFAGMGKRAYGITGDDLFDEFALRQFSTGQTDNLPQVLNTYDWFDDKAEYKRPALCFMAKEGFSVEAYRDAPIRIAISDKYSATSRNYFAKRFPKQTAEFIEGSGDIERKIDDGIADACIDIVLSGNSRRQYGLIVIEPVRFSDIVVIGPSVPKNPWENEYTKILARKANPREGSLTTRMFADQNEWVKKMGAETAEFVAEVIKKGKNLPGEYLDVTYAMMVALAEKNTPWAEVEKQLLRR